MVSEHKNTQIPNTDKIYNININLNQAYARWQNVRPPANWIKRHVRMLSGSKRWNRRLASFQAILENGGFALRIEFQERGHSKLAGQIRTKTRETVLQVVKFYTVKFSIHHGVKFNYL